MQEKLPLWRRIIKTALLTLLGGVLLAAFYIAVIMGNPQEEESSTITARQDQLSAIPASVKSHSRQKRHNINKNLFHIEFSRVFSILYTCFHEKVRSGRLKIHEKSRISRDTRLIFK